MFHALSAGTQTLRVSCWCFVLCQLVHKLRELDVGVSCLVSWYTNFESKMLASRALSAVTQTLRVSCWCFVLCQLVHKLRELDVGVSCCQLVHKL